MKKTSLIERILHIKSPYPSKQILYEYFIFGIMSIITWAYVEIKLAIDSQNLAKKYNFHLHGLTTEYTTFNKYRDFSDYQYRNYRQKYPVLLVFGITFLTLSHLVKKYLNLFSLKIYYLITGVIYTYVFHGTRFIYCYIAIIISFSLTKFYHVLGGKLFVCLTWGICALVKITSEIYHGYSLFNLNQGFFNWFLCYGLIFLRVVSFNMEFKTEVEKNTALGKYEHVEEHCDECKKGFFCLTGLKFVKCNSNDFTFLNYLIYIFYPPLYFSGPTMLFNSFIYQVNHYKDNRHNDFFNKKKIFYLLRLVFIFIVLELFNHFIYVNAFLTNDSNTGMVNEKNFDYFFLASLTFNNLTFLYLKFMFIWRTARVWAWLDGILTEENMNRCVYNNYCFEDFWRQWHRSFNIWLIRYIYVPLGGSSKKIFNIWVVFSFVALWHDLKFNLLIWAWFICFFLVPEILTKNYFSDKSKDYLHEKFWFRIVKYIFCSLYIILQVIANLIGFGMGSEGLIEILKKIYQMTSPLYFLKLWIFFIPTNAFMFYIREYEGQKYGRDKVKF